MNKSFKPAPRLARMTKLTKGRSLALTYAEASRKRLSYYHPHIVPQSTSYPKVEVEKERIRKAVLLTYVAILLLSVLGLLPLLLK